MSLLSLTCCVLGEDLGQGRHALYMEVPVCLGTLEECGEGCPMCDRRYWSCLVLSSLKHLFVK